MNTQMKRSNGNSNLPVTSFSGAVDKIFQDNLSRLFNDDFWGFGGLNRTVNVPVNVKQTDKSYELELIAPGLKKENFKIDVNGEILTVSLEHQAETNQPEQDEGWLRKEYRMQPFSRSFSLDDTINVNSITARYSDGILYISLPQKEGARAIKRTIEIE